MKQNITLALSIIAIVIAGFALYQPATDVTNVVDELRVEVERLHSLNLELGDNLNARIDELGTTIGALSTTVADNAIAAKDYADMKASELFDWVKSILPTDWEIPCLGWFSDCE